MPYKELTPVSALAEGLKDAGVECVYNFPGFHSHEIAEQLGCTQISINERVAYSEAFGAAVAGARSVVTMKTVGLNIALDAFLHSLIAGVNAGLVLVVTDDTHVVGSQEYQDSRHFFEISGGLWYEPSSIEQAYLMSTRAFAVSERLDIPVVIRLSGNYFHLKPETVEVCPTKHFKKQNLQDLEEIITPGKYVIHPYYFKKQEKRLRLKNGAIREYTAGLYEIKEAGSKKALISFGTTSQSPIDVDCDVMKVFTLPLPRDAILKFIKEHDEITVREDGDFFKKVLLRILGEEELKVRFEPQPNRGVAVKFTRWNKHVELFKLLNKYLKDSIVVSEINQSTVETTDTAKVALALGVAVSTAIGVSEVLGKSYAIVGDTSFLHEGRGILEEARRRKVNLGIIILDNQMSWCTGGQVAADSVDLAIAGYSNVTVDLCLEDIDNLAKWLDSFRKLKGLNILRIRLPYLEPIIRS
ncbi:hypothetical protein FBF30_03385 [Candidatus Saccharibacteria bacterium oral taxon 955]|jgi:indolepyruvate ferredoxin oxidoreductase, alpha subunit|nr:hypothetical protein FBF30_03385 [Candidatus Saccharibacteria bacterium oral taxon 955]